MSSLLSSSSDRIAKAAGFLLHSPPGEVDDVFNDIRGLVNDDDALQQHIEPVLAESNMQQFLAAEVPEQQSTVLITPYNQVSSGRYLDPNTRTVFRFDHLRRSASDAQEAGEDLVDSETEGLRAGLQRALEVYVAAHYGSGAVSVFSHEGSVVGCIVSNRFSAGNYWNGSWRAVWSFNPRSGQLNGSTKVRVHYFEEGNVQLDTQSDFAADIAVSGEGDALAKSVADRIARFEAEFQQSINDGYVQLAEKTFRGLRRTLPVTRNKVDWEKIANYKIGGELAGGGAIAKESVHRLCSGQVIVDLATSVKELVENSLDAGATAVDIKLKDGGLTSITVADNGQGISEEGFDSLCRKHWTSKLQSFDDLAGVATFGFRGEALSSLCGVAHVTITTATRESAPMGTQLEYDANGELVGRTAVARERGTTVVVGALFSRWPVRLQDLKRNARREYARLVGIIEQYAIISAQARITLANQSGRAAPVVAVRTPPHADRLARLLAVFGAHLRPHITCFERRVGQTAVSGHISKPIPEAGRGAADKQFFFVNGRPCDFPRAKKLVNELYRAKCPSRMPVFAIELDVGQPGSVDVNLTPDKRTLLLRHEDEVLECLRAALVDDVLEPTESAFSLREGGVKRASSQLAEVLEPPPPTASRPRLGEDKDGEAPDRPAPRIPPTKPRPVAAAARKAAPAPAPSKKMGTVIIGGCRNRMQNDQHDWGSVAERLRTKQARLKTKLDDSQQRELEAGTTPDDSAVREGGLSVTDAEEASTALSRLIHKRDFQRMRVVGQFNRGFIIALLDCDLYIIDQHASDEKYNFEQLQQRAQIASQPLIRPAVLELGVTDEAVAIEFRARLTQNGFHVAVDENAVPGQRLRLMSQPFIDQTLFDQRDLMELVAKLSVNPEAMPRCERARSMFASRACRKSTMIGDPLSVPQMRAIVDHLSELDHPWNCPHGRPTLRHLHRLPDK
ncbi:ATP-binding mismatch repair protein [Coemansia sp. BCRC 34301]|nr:ATP-binding mismatch repair protein [Coemansia sp. BCRC 34301]